MPLPLGESRRRSSTRRSTAQAGRPATPFWQPAGLRCFLADRQSAVAALTRIFIEEIERLLCNASKSSQTGTTGDSRLSRRRTIGWRALGTSGTQAIGITFTSGTGIPGGQPAMPTTGWVDHFGQKPCTEDLVQPPQLERFAPPLVASDHRAGRFAPLRPARSLSFLAIRLTACEPGPAAALLGQPSGWPVAARRNSRASARQASGRIG
jgi:hypothetical protein